MSDISKKKKKFLSIRIWQKKRKQSALIHTHIQWDLVYTEKKYDTKKHIYIIDSNQF
jgi:hypothetical protein